MRWPVLGFAIASTLAGATFGRAEESPTPTQRTVARGDLPADLPGRWLAVAWMKLPMGTRTAPVLWSITTSEGKPSLSIRAVTLPSPGAERLAAANTAGQPWTPAADDLDALAAQWDALGTAAAPVPESVATQIVAHDAFDDALKKDTDAHDALWVVQQTATFPKKTAAVAEEIRLYAVRERLDDGYTGPFLHTAIAMAPFPIPITFRGTFRLYRVHDAPRSILLRALDVLRGCGRRPYHRESY